MVRPRYSKKKIRRAGDLLADAAADHRQLDPVIRTDALAKVGYWRAAHLEPLKETLQVIEEACGKDSATVLVSRLKRIRTIIDKLNRSGYTFNLTTLRDIAGCRVIVASDEEVRVLADKLSTSVGYHTSLDYMSSPKPMGYRGMHVVHRLSAPSFGYDGLDVEIQIRSRLQHDWATAVEAYDIVSGGALKFGLGSDELKEYFRVASDLMCHDAIDESMYKRRLTVLEAKLHVLEQLKEAMNSMYIIDENIPALSRSDSCLITVIPEVQEISLKVFPNEREDEATALYTELESGEDDGTVYLLARASSFEDLKMAYPNYYFNISEFVNWLDSSIG